MCDLKDRSWSGQSLECVVRRDGPLRRLWIIVAVHVLCVSVLVLWPLVLGRTWDALYFCLTGLVVLHWTVFRGECLLSYFEKRCVYERYEMGEAPLRQWFCDVMPSWAGGATHVALWVSVWCSFLTIVARNMRVTEQGSLCFEILLPRRLTCEHSHRI